jgi:hypothetical protein
MKERMKRIKRDLTIATCCTKEEYEAIREKVQKTASKSFSAYARKLLLGQPPVVSAHNHSLDAVVDCMGGLRGQLERLMERPDLSLTERSQVAQLMSEINSIAHKILEACMQK